MTKQESNGKKRGFTDRLAIYVLVVLTIGLCMAFYLGVKSIEADYMGALACFTAAFAPIGTALSITLTAVVGKNKAENTQGGINHLKYEKNGDEGML